MAKITDIVEQKKNKNRVSIFLDGAFCCGIMAETLYSKGLSIGLEISESELEEIQFESEKSQAFDKVLGYVSKSMKTKKQVREYLATKGYLPLIIKYCVDKLIEYKFIDDEEYCRAYVRTYMNKKGARLIEKELRLKGIDFNLIDKAIKEEYDFGSSSAKKIAEKYLKNKDRTKENYAKAYKYLLSKGFTYDETSDALKGFLED